MDNAIQLSGHAMDLTGMIFNRLTAIKPVGKTKQGSIRWFCECACGGSNIVSAAHLRLGSTKGCGCLFRFPEGEAAFNKCYGEYKRKCATDRNHKWKLSMEQFRKITSSNCYYCEQVPSNCQKGATFNGSYMYNGVDRINNKRGYTIDNCVPCCFDCNKAKGTKTTKEFKEWSIRLYNNFGSKKD